MIPEVGTMKIHDPVNLRRLTHRQETSLAAKPASGMADAQIWRSDFGGYPWINLGSTTGAKFNHARGLSELSPTRWHNDTLCAS